MIQTFFKYQSIGNDFIVLDFFKKKAPSFSEQNFSQMAKEMCDRHFGIGADGLLVLTKDPDTGVPSMSIFNSDGSSAEMCVNGLRSVAWHLFSFHNFKASFSIRIKEHLIPCEIRNLKTPLIFNQFKNISYEKEITLSLLDSHFLGHIVSVHNPHFLIFQKQNPEWLVQHGKKLASHPTFAKGINVSFVWQEKENPKTFQVMIYERGCGMTLGCGSSGAAITKTLFLLGQIKPLEEIVFSMPGGSLFSSIDQKGNVFIGGPSTLVYTGKFVLNASSSKNFFKKLRLARKTL